MARTGQMQMAVLLIASCLVTFVLMVAFALRPAWVATVQLTPSFVEGLSYLSNTATARPDAQGTVRCSFFALARESTTVARLEVRTPLNEVIEQPAPRIVDRFAVLPLELHNDGRPRSTTDEHLFRVVAADGRVLAEGTASIARERIMGTENWLIMALGLLASVLQIVGSVAALRRSERPRADAGRQAKGGSGATSR